MRTLVDLLFKKRASIELTRDDVFSEEDDPSWRQKHPLGPVHVQIKCKLCNQIVAEDLKEYGWLSNESFYTKHLQPHLTLHL